MSDQLERLPLLDLPASGLRPFLHAIQDDPEDDLVIRALGDWLEEMGDARAELVRAGLFGDLKRLERWRRAHGERWWGPLPNGARLDVRLGLLELVYPAARLASREAGLPSRLQVLLEQGWVFRVVLEGQAGGPVAPWAEELLQRVTSLRWQDATDGTLGCLPPLERLRELDVGKATGLSNAGLVHLQRWPGLQRLRAPGCGWTWTLRLEGMAELRWLHLSWSPGLIGVQLADLPELRAVFLGMCDRLASVYFTGVPQLRELSLRGSLVTDTTLAQLAQVPSLRSLDLNRCPRIEGMGLVHLNDLTQLRQLVLSECRGLKEVRLEEMPALESLDLGACENLAQLHLCNLPRLARLDLFSTPNLNTVTAHDLPALHTLPVGDNYDLVRLDVAGLAELRSLDLSGLEALTQVRLHNLPAFQHLDVSRCTRLSRLEMEGLSGLRRLIARKCAAMTDDCLAALADVKTLEELILSECPRLIRARLCNLPALRALTVSFCRSLVSLRVAGPCPLQKLLVDHCHQLGEIELADLAELSALRLDALPELTRVALSGLDKLQMVTARGCPPRWTLELSRSSATAHRACDRLRAALPGCQVVRR